MIEFLFLIIAPYIFGAVIAVFLLMNFFSATQRIGNHWPKVLIGAHSAYCIVYFGGDVYRELCATRIFERSAPIISAIERYCYDNDRYPKTLAALAPRYLKQPQNELKHLGLKYIREEFGYSLWFSIDGPPFGHHFIYHPSRNYPEWWIAGVFMKKKELRGWGWFLKV